MTFSQTSHFSFTRMMSARAFCLGAASTLALSLGIAGEGHAQANLPPVTVDAPTQRQVRPAAVQPSRRVTTTRATRVNRGARAPQATAQNNPAPFVERGTGPANGYVAQQSVTATKTDTPLLVTPQAVSVVPRKQIQDQAPQSLSDVLRYTPGATTNRYGVNSLFDTVRVRGFEAPIYLDGLRLPVDAGSNFASGRLEPFGLERLEVLRGPSSGLYGQSPPGGLVNGVSKRPTATAFGDVQLIGGSFDRLQGTFDVGGPVDASGQFLYRLTGLVRDAGTQLDFQRDNRYFFAPSFTWRPNADTSFTVLASVQRSEGRGYQQYVPAVGSALPNPNGRIPYSRYLGEPDFDRFKTDQAWVGYAFEHRFNEYLQFRQNLRYTYAETDLQAFRVDGLLPNQRTGIRNALIVAASTRSLALDNQLQADFATGPLRHKVLAGIDLYEILSTSGFSQTFPAPASPIDIFAPVYGAAPPPPGAFATFLNSQSKQTQVGGYLQDQVSIDRWLLTLTGRADQVSGKVTNGPTLFSPTTTQSTQEDFATTGRVGLSYLFDNGIAPYAAYATSFVPTIGVTATGQAFRPSTGTSQEVGVKFRPLGTNSLFTAALFDITQQNVLTADPTNPLFSVQTGEIRVKGFELEGRFGITDRLDMIAGYSRINPRITKDNVAPIGNVLANTPLESGSLWGLYTFKDSEFAGWGLGAGVRYVGTNFADAQNSFRTQSYTLFDALVSYDFGYRNPDLRGLKLQVNATNLANTYYVSNCNGLAFCALGAARTVLGTLRYSWGGDPVRTSNLITK